MPMPDFQSIFLPLLRMTGDDREYQLRDAYETLADEFGLTPEERKELLPSGRQAIFKNRVGWARTYMVKAGLLESPRRGYIKITSRGKSVLEEEPGLLNVAFLKRYPEFVDFHTAKTKEPSAGSESSSGTNGAATPEEALEEAYQRLRSDLAADLLAKIKECSPEFFETLVVELLVAMGYGGSRKDAGERVGRSGDGGIDGIIKEDRLGLDVIYIQAKRWEGTVGRPELQKFVGALAGLGARKGVFITTSVFSREAEDYVKNLDSKVVLIDGEQLTQHMIDFDLGVSKINNYALKRLDTDYFVEE